MPISSTLLQRFAGHILREGLITHDMKLVVAVSGGADSVALLNLLQLMKTNMHLSLIAVHINHHLRGNDSDVDEQFVKQLCDRLNVNIVVKHIRFDSDTDIENQARIKRREILHKILKSYKFDRIALAHQKNDQAETVLMNFIRGAGITGMGGIKPDSDSIIRPLLAFSRNEIEAWLTENKLDWRQDVSNADNRFTRNRIRNELIPWLENNLNQSVIDRLYLQTGIFQSADDYLKAICKKLLKKLLIEETNEHIILDLVLLRQLNEIEQFYLLRRCFSTLSNTEHEFFMHSFNEIRGIFNSNGSKQTRLAYNIWILKQYDELILTTTNPSLETIDVKELVIDEERTHFVFLNWRFTLKYLKNKPKSIIDTQLIRSVLIDMNKVSLPMKLRIRLAGDRFIPKGMKQEKKLKEFFIDEKVPKFERDNVPILTDNDKILWVVGYRIDARAECTGETNRLLHIIAEPVTKGRKRSASRSSHMKEGKNDIYEF